MNVGSVPTNYGRYVHYVDVCVVVVLVIIHVE